MSESVRVLICGSREWGNLHYIYNFIKSLPEDVVIIEGECSGADLAAKQAAIIYGYEFEPYPADWTKYGKKAGPIRNQQMLDEGKPDIVVGFHENINASKGTKDMFNKAKKAGLKTFLNPKSFNDIEKET